MLCTSGFDDDVIFSHNWLLYRTSKDTGHRFLTHSARDATLFESARRDGRNLLCTLRLCVDQSAGGVVLRPVRRLRVLRGVT